MTRKQKSSPIEDLLTLVSLMPWWVGCILAFVSFFTLRHVANSFVDVDVAPGQIALTIRHAMWKTLATVFQYISG